MTARSVPSGLRIFAALLLGFSVAHAAAAPLCRTAFERSFAINSRKAFDAYSAAFPHQAGTSLREHFGDAASHSFVFTNRSRRPAASHLLLVIPGSAFHPNYMLENLERAVPANTEVAVFEYPYLAPGFDLHGPIATSEQITADIAAGLEVYRHEHQYDSVGIYASSLGGSLVAGLLQSGARVDFLVLDGVQESRPIPFFCSPNGWLEDVLPPLLGGLSRVTLICNRNDPKERTKTLRKLPNTASFTVVELDAKHPWEEDADIELRTPILEKIFERSL
jgi:hypothetical protein